MICDSFAISSEVAAAPCTIAIATALLERLRQVEDMWNTFLVRPEAARYLILHPDELPAFAANADAWGRAAQVELFWTEEIGQVSAAPNAARVHLVDGFSRFPSVPANFVAFHTDDALGRPTCLINYAACGPGWVSAAAHEILEARVNAMLRARSAPAPDGSRRDVEVCDDVQGSDTNVNGGDFLVANACGPRFFGLATEGPLDITGAVKDPFETLPGGYHSGDAGIVYGQQVTEAKRAEVAAHGPRGKLRRTA